MDQTKPTIVERNGTRFVQHGSQRTNIDSASPELIKAAGFGSRDEALAASNVQQIDPNAKGSPIQTSSSSRDKTELNSKKLTDILNQSTKVAQEAAASIGGTFVQGRDEDGDGVADEGTGFQPGTRQDTSQQDGTSDQFGKPTESDRDRIAQIEKEGRSEINRIKNLYSDISARSNASTNGLISAIQRKYEARIESMKETNRRLLRAERTVGLREGRSQFTPLEHAGFLQDEEIQGHLRISELEAEMLSLIAEAEDARTSRDIRLLNEKMDRISEVEKEEKEQIKDLYRLAVDREKELTNRLKEQRTQEQADFDNAIETAERSAPALVNSLSKYEDADVQYEILKRYAETNKIPIDILVGEVETATRDIEKHNLDLQNIRSLIANRSEDNKKSDSGFLKETENVISGATTLDQLSGDKKQDVIAELREAGYYRSTPPQWYVDMLDDQLDGSLSPEGIKKRWEEYRSGIIETI